MIKMHKYIPGGGGGKFGISKSYLSTQGLGKIYLHSFRFMHLLKVYGVCMHLPIELPFCTVLPLKIYMLKPRYSNSLYSLSIEMFSFLRISYK